MGGYLHYCGMLLQMGVPDVDLDSFPEPGERYNLAEELGQGAFGRVFEGQDNEANGRKVAIKIQKVDQEFIRRECVVLRDFCQHPNLVEVYGVFLCRGSNEIWFVMEVCK